MRDAILQPEHRDFRDLARDFIAREIVPSYDDWERDGIVSRAVWRAAGGVGLLGCDVDEAYGGGGVDDIRYPLLLTEELARAGVTGVGFSLHNDIVAPYLRGLTTPEQRQRWLPGFCAGDMVTAIAITEPDGGSDLGALRTTAVRDGDSYRLHGAKSFVSNGILADLVIVAANTHPRQRDGGLSLLVVERGMPGFERGPKLAKLGLAAQDTADLFFDDVLVPAANLLGTAGHGGRHLTANLPRERLSIAVAAVAGAEAVFAETLAYCGSRRAFGQPIGSFQHIRFELAEMSTELHVARAYVDRCIVDVVAGPGDAVEAARAKWWTTDVQRRVVDRCLQLHGGVGYLRSSRVGRAFADTRMMPIYGGTNEIMKEIIGRSMGM
jgi:alkylation response protein AidB-like acyl-CoA dehydrogenase